MEVKERRPYCSLSKSRKDKQGAYTGSSGDSEDCAIGSHGLRVPTQKSYSSSETLKAFDQHQDQTRLLYGTTKGHKDMVHHEQDDYNRQGQHFSLRQLGICEPPSRRGLAFCSEMGLPHHGFSVGTAQDLDADSQAVMSPERAMRLWGRGGLGKSSGRSSCLSSRSNSVLTLTDTEHENKSDSDNAREPETYRMKAEREGAAAQRHTRQARRRRAHRTERRSGRRGEEGPGPQRKDAKSALCPTDREEKKEEEKRTESGSAVGFFFSGFQSPSLTWSAEAG
ncbi:teneurin-3 [Chelmon rostratus]|uniref:teneurin-3 n=1 Tax=Chelmon rostratus TaxID=109905 RepID=UPI001BEA0C5C|nr:teneurin-3 [Chelmon rostratus]